MVPKSLKRFRNHLYAFFDFSDKGMSENGHTAYKFIRIDGGNTTLGLTTGRIFTIRSKQLSSKLWHSNKPCCAFIIPLSPNLKDNAMDGFSTIQARESRASINS